MSNFNQMIFELGVTITERSTGVVLVNKNSELIMKGRGFEGYQEFVEALDPVVEIYSGYHLGFAFERARKVFLAVAPAFEANTNAYEMIGKGGTHDFFTAPLGKELKITHHLKLKAVERESVEHRAVPLTEAQLGNVLFANAIAELTTERLKNFDMDRVGSFHLQVDVEQIGTQLKLTARRPLFNTVFRPAQGEYYENQGNRVVLQMSGVRDWAPLFYKHDMVFERNRLGAVGFETVVSWYVPASLLKLKADHAAKRESGRKMPVPPVKLKPEFAYVACGKGTEHTAFRHAFAVAQQRTAN